MRHDRRPERNAVLLPLRPTRRASLPGHANFLDARQLPGRGKIANVAVDLGLEQIGRDEACNIERDDELPDIELAAGRCSKILDIAAEGRAVEPAREPSDDDREAAGPLIGP